MQSLRAVLIASAASNADCIFLGQRMCMLHDVTGPGTGWQFN
jgi:hypothetical protein